MNLYQKFAFSLYATVALLLFLTGATYLSASSLMPYHLDAMGSTWQELSPGMQTMSLNFMKSVSAGFLSASVAILLLLLFPFRRGELWAALSILTIILIQVGVIAVRTYDVAVHTAANPPFLPLVMVLAVAVLGCVFSIAGQKSR